MSATPGEEGPTVGELAAALGGHENTVRHHLAALTADRMVEARTDPPQNRRGRPAVRYRLTPRGHAALASGQSMVGEYVALAGAFSQRLAERGEPVQDDARAIGRAWGTSLHARSGVPIGTVARADASAPAPVPMVLATLTRLGFSPALDPSGPPPAARVLLRTCPLLEAARTYPRVVCEVHRGLVEGLLDAAGALPAPHPADAVRLDPFAEPGACVLHLRTAPPGSGRDARESAAHRPQP